MHEVEARRFAELARELSAQLAYISREQWRQVRVHDRRIAPRDQPDEWRDFVRDRDLAKADLARDVGRDSLVLRVAIAMQERDRRTVEAAGMRCAQVGAQSFCIERLEHFASRIQSFTRFDHFAVQQLGKTDMSGEKLWAILIADAKCIAESCSDDEHGAFALALEKCVGRERSAHAHAFDAHARFARL